MREGANKRDRNRKEGSKREKVREGETNIERKWS